MHIFLLTRTNKKDIIKLLKGNSFPQKDTHTLFSNKGGFYEEKNCNSTGINYVI